MRRGAHHATLKMAFPPHRRLTTVQPRPTISPQPTTHLILHLCTQGQLQEALSLFYALESQPNSQTYASLLKTCARHGSLAEGRALHRHMLTNHHHQDLFLSNHLINMYAKCGCLEAAHKVFDEMPQRNLVSWTALITGYDQSNRPDECFQLFSVMITHCLPNEFAIASVLSSCNWDRGRQVHALALKTSFDGNVFVGNALITMYSRCCGGSIEGRDSAWLVYQNLPMRNLITWNSMIVGFKMAGCTDRSLRLFAWMHCDGIQFDHATLISVISSCCGGVDDFASLKQLHQLHSLMIKASFVSEVEVATALVKAYSKVSHDINDCYKVFLETKNRDIVSWTGIITSCAECQPEEALLLFCQLRRDGFDPDLYTFSIVIKACASLVTERHGSATHALIIKVGFEDDMVLANALIHAYARCGSINQSEQIFNHMQARDTVSWNSMIKAYAMHGRGNDALQVFARMDVQPDGATFVGLLSACAHAGMVNQGRELFDAMVEHHGIAPQCDHFACMVDMLGRVGRLTEAEDLINQMPMPPDSVVWSALLGACRKHSETIMGERAARKLIELEPKKSVGYVMMSNIYCASGSFRDAGFIRKEMKDCGTRKEVGLSWIEIGNQVHEFAAGGRRHPQRETIYLGIERLVCQLKEMGYVPETSLVLHEVEKEHKEEQLYHHSEKLALVFGLMNASRSTGAIRIMKNIRICLDCHNFMKLASDCIGREIVVRDANRFHHFRGGMCSCSDYW
ncbi:pentatricopeptide repeat-containing protein At1g71420 [Magnolia sinica]|uniref:pentatricopeptide repeat-containing protein At1g71420 n=1 Tax=Magnolia sinica TaxID=86752 RepID=UPI00265B472B|nr:pentatricopeptide repeat-containing protein At1g71420 [Magnolia sinica]XP_058078442.1 pentatricopeptide repeat-containing protein At1g71420 [Magnolia sinica]XP_058078443.1 pentatricopeptide repeat-containing protein At1g71420 [Magnolia sinica]XP_058078444.1 pentatricopeptide repeat-containing protein At1g71420 [Magnolia sinica]